MAALFSHWMPVSSTEVQFDIIVLLIITPCALIKNLLMYLRSRVDLNLFEASMLGLVSKQTNKTVPQWYLELAAHGTDYYVCYSGLCSSRAQWPLAPNFSPRMTRKTQIFHTNHMLGTPDFTVSEHSRLPSIFLRAQPCSWMTSSSNFLHRNNTHVCWVPWILQVQGVGLPSIFLRVRPFSNQLNYVILFMGNL